LMQPLGNIEKVLSKYGLEEEKSRSIWWKRRELKWGKA
jgi:hypothetical protein